MQAGARLKYHASSIFMLSVQFVQGQNAEKALCMETIAIQAKSAL